MGSPTGREGAPCAALLPGDLLVVVGGTQLEWMGENRRVWGAEITK